jgi:S-adenosylmethionine/arginine decarboxylase-like enzyme
MDEHLSPILYSADLGACAALPVLTAEEVVDLFVSALDRAGATIVDLVYRAFPSTGFTCVVILLESHAVMHAWPQTGTINIDIFPSSTQLKSVQAINELGQTFGARRLSIQEIARGDGSGQHPPPLHP